MPVIDLPISGDGLRLSTLPASGAYVVFHGDFLFWRTGDNYEVLARSNEEHKYALGCFGKEWTVGSPTGFQVSGATPGQGKMDRTRIFTLSGCAIDPLQREKVMMRVELPRPDRILYRDKGKLPCLQNAWMQNIKIGENFGLGTGKAVSRPGAVFHTIVFAYDSSASLTVRNLSTGREFSRHAAYFVATGLLEAGPEPIEDLEHIAQAGNATARLAGVGATRGAPRIFQLGGSEGCPEPTTDLSDENFREDPLPDDAELRNAAADPLPRWKAQSEVPVVLALAWASPSEPVRQATSAALRRRAQPTGVNPSDEVAAFARSINGDPQPPPNGGISTPNVDGSAASCAPFAGGDDGGEE